MMQPLTIAALVLLEAVIRVGCLSSPRRIGLGRKRNDVLQGRGRGVDGSSGLCDYRFDA